MDEATIIKTQDELPHGRDWVAYDDANVVVLASHLDGAGRDRALDEVAARWRRPRLRIVLPAAVAGTITAGVAAMNQSAMQLAAVI